MELTSAAVRAMLEAGEFAPYEVIVEALATEYDVADIAAAAIKLADDAAAPKATDVDLPSPTRDRKIRRTRSGSPGATLGEGARPAARMATSSGSTCRSGDAPGFGPATSWGRS